MGPWIPRTKHTPCVDRTSLPVLLVGHDHRDELEGVVEAAPVLPVDAVVETAAGGVRIVDVVVSVEQCVGTVVVPPAGPHVKGTLVHVRIVVGLKQEHTSQSG